MKMYTYQDYQVEANQRQEQARRQALVDATRQDGTEKITRRRYR